MTLVVLGIDALDHKQVEYFDFDEFYLDNYRALETFTYMWDRPHTGEVWPTVATGLHPREHGITKSGEAEWDNLFVEFASKFTADLPLSMRRQLGELANATMGAEWSLSETDADSFLDGDHRVCHNWPGVYRSSELERLWKKVDLLNKSDSAEVEFDRDLLGEAAEKFGWIEEMLDHELALIATHIHIIDLSGHVYTTNEGHYRSFYEWTARHVRDVLNAMDEDDELLILSDHGMGAQWLNDEADTVGVHSMRAHVASTIDEPLPKSVFEAREWIESRIPDVNVEETDLDLPEEQLRQLGYIE